MKVHELIALLTELPQDSEVVISKDGEGNGFSPLSNYCVGMYEADTTWSGEFISEEDAKEESCEYKENAVVLWPVN